MAPGNFSEVFRHLTGRPPFPWQDSLYERFAEKKASLDLEAAASRKAKKGKKATETGRA